MAELELSKLRGMVENAMSLTSEAREAAERDRDYYDHHQWTAGEVAVLHKRKQPVITINRIQRKIDAMVGIEQRGRTDPRALARNPQDEDLADVATKVLVYVDDQSRFDQKASLAFQNLLIEGYGGVEVGVEMVRGDYEVAITRLRWEEIFYDPYSRECDFSDARYMGVMKWMSADQAQELYPDADPDMFETTSFSLSEGETYEDRPYEFQTFWVDKRQRRVRVAQMYYRNAGVWYLGVFTGKGEVQNGPSPYLDEDGEPSNPMILMSAYVDRENKRYGVVRSMISAQDEINKRRSKLLHMLNSRQTVGAKGAVNSVAEVKRELAAPDGHIEVEPDVNGRIDTMFQILPNQDQVAGQASLLQEAKAEIDLLGPNPALLGENGASQSGRSILAQQQASLAELGPVYDMLRDWKLRVYRAIWQRVRQYWKKPRYVRITDELDAPEYLAINVPVMDPMTGGVAIDPQTGEPMMQNVPAQVDVDIVISDAPDYATLQAEQFEQLTQLVQAGVQIPPRAIILASSLRNKAEILEMLEGDEDAQAQQAQQAQVVQEMQMRGAMAEIAGKEAKAARDQASAMRDMAGVEAEQAATRKTAEEAEKVDAETAKVIQETMILQMRARGLPV